jgi:hypothetical protein
MDEQKGYWGTFELLEEKKNEEYNLLSDLIDKTNIKAADSSLFAFINKAIRYFSSQSESFRTYFNDNINKITDYTKLIGYLDKYSAFTAEEKVLKYEILNLLFAIPNISCVCNVKYNTDMSVPLKNEIALLDAEFKKKYCGEILASEATLLSKCVKYRNWGEKCGRCPVEEFTTQVFCHIFNYQGSFKKSVLRLLNNDIKFCNNEDMMNTITADKDLKASPEQPDGKNRWDVVISIKESVILIENKLGARVKNKETCKYLKAINNSSKTLGYFWLTPMPQDKFNDVIKQLRKEKLEWIDTIKHISWIYDKDNIFELVNKCIETSKPHEKIYLLYFRNLIKSATANLHEMTIKNFLEDKEGMGEKALKVFDLIKKELDWEIDNSKIWKDGCIYGIPIASEGTVLCPFRITPKGTFNVQWLGGTKSGRFQQDGKYNKLKAEFIELLNIKKLNGKKCSFKIESADVQVIKKAVVWLKGEASKKEFEMPEAKLAKSERV